jgi:predicted membrane-bound spermidine synthase
MCYIDRDCLGRDYDNTFLDSHYQEMKFKHCPELDNSCLTLVGVIQACTSFRPHYHESFVHVPAQFAKEMKRVAYLGGGDNMLLYEILKYPELELVVGLELGKESTSTVVALCELFFLTFFWLLLIRSSCSTL